MKFDSQNQPFFTLSDLVAIVLTYSLLALGQKVMQGGFEAILENLSRGFSETMSPCIREVITIIVAHVNKTEYGEEKPVAKENNKANTSHKAVLSPGAAVLVPGLRVSNLFPDVSHEEACSLLRSHGLLTPNKAFVVEHLDEATQKAIQDVVEILLNRCSLDEPGGDDHVECPICLMEYPIQQFVSCRDGGHIFCCKCVKRYATEMLFGTGTLGVNKETKEAVTELLCIADGCLSGFPQTHLEKVLTLKELERYGELQGAVNMTKASLEDLRSCPKCGFKALLPPTIKTFSCPADGCGHVSCVDCREQAHGKLTCAEAMQDKQDKTRQLMEEDMTAALLRVCPNPVCAKPMLKDGGCNKLNCRCGWSMCNVCKMRIDGYNHFCQTFECQHDTCGKCSVWNSTDTADAEAIRRAEEKGQERFKQMNLPQVTNVQKHLTSDRTKTAAKQNRKGPFHFIRRSLRKKPEKGPAVA